MPSSFSRVRALVLQVYSGDDAEDIVQDAAMYGLDSSCLIRRFAASEADRRRVRVARFAADGLSAVQDAPSPQVSPERVAVIRQFLASLSAEEDAVLRILLDEADRDAAARRQIARVQSRLQLRAAAML